MTKLLFLLFSTLSLYAHPHTFIDVYPSVVFHNGIANTIHFRWKIDEMTSSMLVMDVDTNGDGKIDKKESKFIEENYFNVFSDYDFYTFIKIKGKQIIFPTPKNFTASIENHRVVYAFDIQGTFDKRYTALEFGDTDFYVAMVLKDKFVKIKGATAKVLDVDGDFYYGYRMEFR